MHRLSQSIAVIGGCALAGCAAHRADPPLLTARASKRIAATCGAVKSEFHPRRTGLPYATFVTRSGETLSPDGTSPTVRCIGEALTRYRHSMLAFRSDDVAAP